MRITKKYLKIIRTNRNIVARLINETGKAYPTVMRWFEVNSEMLTTATALKVICEELKVKQSDILEERKDLNAFLSKNKA